MRTPDCQSQTPRGPIAAFEAKPDRSDPMWHGPARRSRGEKQRVIRAGFGVPDGLVGGVRYCFGHEQPPAPIIPTCQATYQVPKVPTYCSSFFSLLHHHHLVDHVANHRQTPVVTTDLPRQESHHRTRSGANGNRRRAEAAIWTRSPQPKPAVRPSDRLSGLSSGGSRKIRPTWNTHALLATR